MQRCLLLGRLLHLLLLLVVLSGWGVGAWNVGEIVPVTLQIRVSRVIPSIAVERDEDDDDDVQIMDQGKQFLRPLPPEFCPRFGVNRRVHQPAEGLFEQARKTANSTGNSLSDVAVRFQLERGLSKATAWLPLLRATTRPSSYDTEKRDHQSPGDANMLYLASVTFTFGYQEGAFNKITTFRAEPVYATVPSNDIELQYHWHEKRAYTPHKALTVCAFASVFATMVALYMILVSFHSISNKIRMKEIALRNHRE